MIFIVCESWTLCIISPGYFCCSVVGWHIRILQCLDTEPTRRPRFLLQYTVTPTPHLPNVLTEKHPPIPWHGAFPSPKEWTAIRFLQERKRSSVVPEAGCQTSHQLSWLYPVILPLLLSFVWAMFTLSSLWFFCFLSFPHSDSFWRHNSIMYSRHMEDCLCSKWPRYRLLANNFFRGKIKVCHHLWKWNQASLYKSNHFIKWNCGKGHKPAINLLKYIIHLLTVMWYLQIMKSGTVSSCTHTCPLNIYKALKGIETLHETWLCTDKMDE